MLSRRRFRRSPRTRREGAAMLVVMVVLLMVSSLAVFSVHSTTRELRAAGHQRQAMQARFFAQAGIDSTFGLLDNPAFGPAGLDHVMDQTLNDATYGVPTMQPFEPDVLPNRPAYRMFSRNFSSFGGFDPAPQYTLGDGARDAYEPGFEVDVTDYFEFTGTIAGESSSGGGSLRFIYATYTSRARLRLPDADGDGTRDDYQGLAAEDPRRDYHEVAHAARAYGVSGPF